MSTTKRPDFDSSDPFDSSELTTRDFVNTHAERLCERYLMLWCFVLQKVEIPDRQISVCPKLRLRFHFLLAASHKKLTGRNHAKLHADGIFKFDR